MGRKKSSKANKGSPYKGLLADPLAIPFHRLDANNQPPWFGGTPEDWRQQARSINDESMRRYLECMELVCIHHGVDIRSENLGWDLARALLEAHVPAFNFKASIKKSRAKQPTRSGAPTRLNMAGTIYLLGEAGKRLEENPEISDRQLADELSKLSKFQKLPLKFETIRKLLPQIRSAWTAYRSGKPTEFQTQLIDDVLPFLADQHKKTDPDVV